MNMQVVSEVVLREKYLKGDEKSATDLFSRVSRGIAKAEKTQEEKQSWGDKFYEMMLAGGIGGGRIMSAGGTDIQATLINCFVQPVGDAIQGISEDGYPGIYEALREAAETMRRGGGVGYDFSRIRPRGAIVKGTFSEASGPCSYMDVFDASCCTVESAGARRGAQMGVLRIDHPDVMEFITAKRTFGRWTNFNVSLLVEDAFISALRNNDKWELIHKAEPSERFKSNNPGVYQRESDNKWVYKEIDARELWDIVMKSNYDFAEPGILLGSQFHKENNLYYVEKLEATNPCAEHPLPPYGCCDLGQIILTNFVRNPFTSDACFDWDKFESTVSILVRFLDNVLEVTHWPLEQQKKEAMNKRRIGGGFTGLGSATAMLGLIYGSEEGCNFAKEVSERLRNAAYLASIDLAIERGPFPLLNKESHLNSGFAKRLPDFIKDRIKQHGIRNSHLLSIAPTGTVSLAFGDNCSNGIEPIFSLAYKRNKRSSDGGTESFEVLDHALRVFIEVGDVSKFVSKSKSTAFKQTLLDAICSYTDSFIFENINYKVVEVLPPSLVTAQSLTVDQHLAVLAAVQPYIDAAISKTINVPEDYPFEDFKNIYLKANDLGLKGVACYRPNPIRGAVLEAQPAKKTEAAVIKENEIKPDFDPATVVISKRPHGNLDAVVKKVPYSGPDGDATMYITVSFTEIEGVIDGEDIVETRPVEVFITASPDGVPSEWVAAYARSLSLLARAGVELLAKALQDGRGVRSDKGRVRYGYFQKSDGSKVPRFHGSEVALIAYAIQEILISKNILNEWGFYQPQQVRSKKINTQHQLAIDTKPIVENVNNIQAGKECKECGAHAVIKKDGCEFCTNCGSTGSCG